MVMQKRRVAGRGGTAARNPTGCITVYRAPAIVNHCVAAKLIVVVGRTERPVGLVALGQTFVRRGQDERQGSPPPAQPALFKRECRSRLLSQIVKANGWWVGRPHSDRLSHQTWPTAMPSRCSPTLMAFHRSRRNQGEHPQWSHAPSTRTGAPLIELPGTSRVLPQ